MPRRSLAPLFCALSLVFATPAVAAPGSQSSPIAISANGSTLVNVNPDSDTVSVFGVNGDALTLRRAIGVGDEPVSVAIHRNGKRAFVACSRGGVVSVLDLTNQRLVKNLKVGREPAAVALSPSGKRLYVANASTGNLMIFDTTRFKKLGAVNLEPFGRSPRAISVTNDGDGDDKDETVFVAMFFGELRAGKTSLHEGQDDQREGRVVAISGRNSRVLGQPIVLGPMASTGFNSNGRLAPASGIIPAIAPTNPQTFTTPTGAYPNQLAGIAIHPTLKRAFVVSTAASPNGPLRFNHMAQGLVSVFDTTTRAETVAAQTDPTFVRTSPLNLNQGVNRATVPEPRLFLTNPVAMAWRPNGADAWVAVQNSDVLVRVTTDAKGVPSIGAPVAPGLGGITRVDLLDVGEDDIPGQAPRGIAINAPGQRAYVSNYISRSVTVVDIANAVPEIVGTIRSSPLPAPGSREGEAHIGASLFFTGRGAQGRMSSESWGGCITCHPQGRSDNVTWMFDAGPRQTIPLDSTFNTSSGTPPHQRLLNWSAVRDENQDFELNTRGVFGGRGLIDDDRLFLAIGGAACVGPTDFSLFEQFQQFTGAVTTTNDLTGGNLPTTLGARRDFGVATLSDDRVFIIGGRTGPGFGTLVPPADSVMEFNPRTNTLTRRESAGFTPRHSLGAAGIRTGSGFRIYAVGGYDSTAPAGSPVNTAQEYDPVGNTWRTVASLPQAVSQFGITVTGGHNSAEPSQLIHVVGGNTGSEVSPSVASPFGVQRLLADPAGPGVWTGLNPTGLIARHNHGAATALRGVQSRVFVIGGQTPGGTIDSVQEYAGQAGFIIDTPHTSLPAPRSHFGASSSLSTNQVYVFGGVNELGVDQSTIFEYSIANNGTVAGPTGTPSGTWTTRGSLSAPRRSLGVSTPPGVTNFLTAPNTGRDVDQDAIVEFLKTIRTARAPVPATNRDARRGRNLFGRVGLVVPKVSCASCHGGPNWSRSMVDYDFPPSPATGLGLGLETIIGAELRSTGTQPNVLFNVGTFIGTGRQNEIRFNGADISQAIGPLGANGFNIPSLLSVHETGPYYYSGLAQTLQEVLDGSQDGNGGARVHFVKSATQRAQLIQFLRSIDEATPIFP